MPRIIFATGNADKMREIRQILGDLPMEIVSMKEAGVRADIVEDGTTFEENAVIKASAIRDLTGEIVLADDSGLEVDYLDKAPGVYSARFMGEDTSYTIKNQYILDQLKDVTGDDRSARFVCAIAAAFPDGTVQTVRRTVEGVIGDAPRGENGFGYDPIFVVPAYGCSTGELPPEVKNEISHRGKALRAIEPILAEWIRTHQN